MSTELIKQESQALAVGASLIDDMEVPDDVLIIPRINLLQATSKVVQYGDGKQGTFYNSVTGHDYGKEITLIPLKTNFGAVYIVNGEGMKCKTVNGIESIRGDVCRECPFGVYHKAEWKDGKPPECASTIDMLCLETSTQQPAIVTFKSKSYKEGQRIVTTLKLRGKEPLSVTLRPFQDKNDKGVFHVFQLKSLQTMTADQYTAAAEWKKRLSGKKVEVHEDDLPPL